MIGFFRNKKFSPEQRFWNWVLKNKIALEKFITSDHRDYQLYNQLTRELHKYSTLLYPELTMTRGNEFVLIITPDGNSEGINPTQKLFNNKPEIENWIIKKFRQASDEIDLNFDGLEFPSSDLQVIPEIDEEREKINIHVFIRNMNSDTNRHQSLAMLYLDHILGEFNTITQIGYIDFHHLDTDQSVKGGISILQLRKLIEKKLYTVDHRP